MNPEMAEHYSLILVGSSFASSFFLLEYLERAGPEARVLVLERGERVSHSQLTQHRDRLREAADASFVNRTPKKPWVFSVGFGGASNCWWACAPRFLPEDFALHSRYGVGRDWPLSYDDLETFYSRTEEVMACSGPADGGPAPRSRPYPQPPHRFSTPDRLMKAAFPALFFEQPNARTSRSIGSRPACCNAGVCRHCPINAKFTVQNSLTALFEDPRVQLLCGATVRRVNTRNDVATGVEYEFSGREQRADAELVALGAGGIHNPFLLLRSGFDDPGLGRHLHEQTGALIDVDLDGVENFDGGTSITALGYMLYAGAHRRERAAILFEFWNAPRLRNQRGKWRQFLRVKALVEDLPSPESRVAIDPDDPERPSVSHAGVSDYARAAVDALPEQLPAVLSPLPVEDYSITPLFNSSESHILGTTMMGSDPRESVVDRHLVHHRVRNLVVLGSGAFPSGSPANPTLTLAALSLWSASHLLEKGRPA